jgi:hypothetical protein
VPLIAIHRPSPIAGDANPLAGARPHENVRERTIAGRGKDAQRWLGDRQPALIVDPATSAPTA